jgi:hypothetical protein
MSNTIQIDTKKFSEEIIINFLRTKGSGVRISSGVPNKSKACRNAGLFGFFC